MNMLRELRCADSLNKTYLDNYFTDEELWLMVTRNAAASAPPTTSSARSPPASWADIAIFDGSTARRPPRRHRRGARRTSSLVMRAGKLLYGDAAVVDALGADRLRRARRVRRRQVGLRA